MENKGIVAARLKETLLSAGWPDVIAIMNQRVEAAEFNLMNYNGVDSRELTALHRRARDMREFFEQVQKAVMAAIEEEIPQAAFEDAYAIPGFEALNDAISSSVLDEPTLQV